MWEAIVVIAITSISTGAVIAIFKSWKDFSLKKRRLAFESEVKLEEIKAKNALEMEGVKARNALELERYLYSLKEGRADAWDADARSPGRKAAADGGALGLGRDPFDEAAPRKAKEKA